MKYHEHIVLTVSVTAEIDEDAGKINLLAEPQFANFSVSITSKEQTGGREVDPRFSMFAQWKMVERLAEQFQKAVEKDGTVGEMVPREVTPIGRA